jgi:hypothetical protein
MLPAADLHALQGGQPCLGLSNTTRLLATALLLVAEAANNNNHALLYKLCD